MYCPRCHRALRQDQGFVFVQVCSVGATYSEHVCPDCAAGQPARKTYPVGVHPPSGVEVCGVCRQALRFGERIELMRLAPEDLIGTDHTEAGAFATCPECIARWKPIIFERHKRNGLLEHMGQFTQGHLA